MGSISDAEFRAHWTSHPNEAWHLYGGWGRAGADGNDKLHQRSLRHVTLRSETHLLVATRTGSEEALQRTFGEAV